MDNSKENLDIIVKEAQVDYNRKYTYSDYLLWEDDKRRELIDGVPYLMSAPGRKHQEILGNLHVLFANFLKGKPCKVYLAPFDVRLNADTLDNTVVQPDLLIVCDHSKLNDAGCKGAPDMVVEILSPSTSRHDNTIKFNTYLKNGVREYWVINPETKTIAVHILKDNNYITHAYLDDAEVSVHILDDCLIDLSEVFAE